jgi:hypothetical protein
LPRANPPPTDPMLPRIWMFEILKNIMDQRSNVESLNLFKNFANTFPTRVLNNKIPGVSIPEV